MPRGSSPNPSLYLPACFPTEEKVKQEFLPPQRTPNLSWSTATIPRSSLSMKHLSHMVRWWWANTPPFCHLLCNMCSCMLLGMPSNDSSIYVFCLYTLYKWAHFPLNASNKIFSKLWSPLLDDLLILFLLILFLLKKILRDSLLPSLHLICL